MKRILIAVVAILVLAGGGYLLANRGGNNDTENSAKTNNSENKSKMSIKALPTTDSSYIATITTTSAGKTDTATMEYDKNSGAVRYTVGAGGSTTTIIYTKDAYYMCQASGKCYKYPHDKKNSSGFDPGSYEYSKQKLDELKDKSVYQGTKPCPAGTCRVWQAQTGSYTSSIYVDTETDRISQVEGGGSNGTAKIVYEYSDVRIILPAGAQTVSPGSIPGI